MRGRRLARDLNAVGIVLIVTVPIVGVNDEAGPEQAGGTGDGARLGLVKNAPIAVEVGPNPIGACLRFGPIGVDHGDEVQGDMVQGGAQGRVAALCHTVDEAQNSLGGGRLVAVLAA